MTIIVTEVIVLVFLTQTISVTLPLIDAKCREPRCYAINANDANSLGQVGNDRYLQSCNVAYQGLPEPMPPLNSDFHPFNCMKSIEHKDWVYNGTSTGTWGDDDVN